MTLSLAEEINAAAKLVFSFLARQPSSRSHANAFLRPHHTALNQLLLQLLPLSLPPDAPNHRLYAYGISHILPIYSAFESAINSLLHSQRSVNPLLRRLHISDLERSPRLQRDLRRLLPASYLQTLSLYDNCTSKLDTHSKDDDSTMLSRELTAFITHIHESISAKPHLYLSYTWVLYMAIFSGGRYIRAKLKSAGEEFWANTLLVESSKNKYGHWGAKVEEPENWPLSFWSFPGSSDGEDLKVDYKSRVGELEQILTLDERAEIINEAVEIMKRILQIVRKIEIAVVEGAAEEILGAEMCQSHTAEINSMPSHKHDSNISLNNGAAPGDPYLSTLLSKHLPMGTVELLAAIKNAFFSAGRRTKVQDAVPVNID